MSISGTNMNCDAFKEAIAADPSGAFDGAEHADGCASCAAYREEMRSLDAKITRALAIDVPELKMPELPSIADDNVTSLPVTRKRRGTTWIAIAASFALAAIVGVWMFGGPGITYGSLEEEILAHIDHEPGSLRVTDVPVSDAQYSAVVNPDIGSMDRDVGLVSYAMSCVIHGHTVPHLVIQGKKGPITLILMPEEEIDAARTFTGESVIGVLIPHGDGSIAIVGERDEDLGELEERVVDSVEWSI